MVMGLRLELCKSSRGTHASLCLFCFCCSILPFVAIHMFHIRSNIQCLISPYGIHMFLNVTLS